MAKKPEVPATPDMAAMFAAFLASQTKPTQAAKTGPTMDLSAIGAAVAKGDGEFRPNKNGNGGYYLVVKFAFNGKLRCLNVGGF